MKICPHCNSQIDETLTSCPYCGGPVNRPDKDSLNKPISKLGLVSFILSFILPLIPAAMIMAVIAIIYDRKWKKIGFAIAGLAVSVLLILLLLIFRNQIIHYIKEMMVFPPSLPPSNFDVE